MNERPGNRVQERTKALTYRDLHLLTLVADHTFRPSTAQDWDDAALGERICHLRGHSTFLSRSELTLTIIEAATAHVQVAPEYRPMIPVNAAHFRLACALYEQGAGWMGGRLPVTPTLTRLMDRQEDGTVPLGLLGRARRQGGSLSFQLRSLDSKVLTLLLELSEMWEESALCARWYSNALAGLHGEYGLLRKPRSGLLMHVIWPGHTPPPDPYGRAGAWHGFGHIHWPTPRLKNWADQDVLPLLIEAGGDWNTLPKRHRLADVVRARRNEAVRQAGRLMGLIRDVQRLEQQAVPALWREQA